MTEIVSTQLLDDIREILIASRQTVVQSVNSEMVLCYWQIGRVIVEDEQQGQGRAEYGKGQLKQLSQSLQAEFGKGFDASNLRNMRQFYLTFPICDSVRHKLSWTQYRTLMRAN